MRPRAGQATVALAVGTTVAGSMPVFLVGALFVHLQTDTGAPAWALGVAVAVYWAVAAVVSTSAGTLIGKIGSRTATIVSLGMVLVSLIGIAAFSPHWILVVAWAGMGGAGNSLGHPASNQLMSQGVRRVRLATAFGIKQGAVPFAAFLAGLAVPVFASSFGWRAGFAAAAALAGVLLGTFLLCSPRAPRSTVAVARPTRLPTPLVRYLLLMSCATTLGAAAAGVASAYAVSAGVARGIPVAAAGVVLSVGSVLGAIIRVVCGRIADRVGSDIALPLTAGLLVAGALGSTLIAWDHTVAFVIGIVLALGPGWGWTGLTHFVVSRVAGPSTPAATGIVQTGSYLGSGGGPLVFGVAFALAGTGPLHTLVWVPVGIAQVIAAVIVVYLARRKPPEITLDRAVR